MNSYLGVIITSLVLAWALGSLARYLNLRAIDPTLPAEFEGFYDPDKYRASQEYLRANARLGLLEDTGGLVVVLGLILGGGFAWLDAQARAISPGGPVANGLVFFGLIGIGADLLATPFDVYRTFVLEARYGFNRTTPGLYLADRLKGLGLSAVLGGAVLAAVILFFSAYPRPAWLLSWLAVVLFSLGLQYLAPTLILPLFNTFRPLEDGELKRELEDLTHSTGFALAGVQVMDGSKRSTKSNAFFTGFGKKKRIALFDTLLSRHSPREIKAVLAHELGHYRLGHIRTGIVLQAIRLLVLFYLLSLFVDSPALHQAFGLSRTSVHTGLLFFMLLYTPVSMVLSVAMSYVSRLHEYQADRFAARATNDAEGLVLALKRLTVDSLGNLTPHPLFVLLNYSHPPILARIRSLRSLRL